MDEWMDGNRPQVNKGDIDRGGGEDEALEVNEREEVVAESRKGEVMKRMRDLGKKSNPKRLRATNVTV